MIFDFAKNKYNILVEMYVLTALISNSTLTAILGDTLIEIFGWFKRYIDLSQILDIVSSDV